MNASENNEGHPRNYRALMYALGNLRFSRRGMFSDEFLKAGYSIPEKYRKDRTKDDDIEPESEDIWMWM